MFCSKKMNKKINRLNERALRMVYSNYSKTYEELLREDQFQNIHHHNIHYLATKMYMARIFGPTVWNTMLKESPSINIFKDRIKSYVLNSCKCRLCNDHNNDFSCGVCAD